jgi:hypothetical protein
VAETPAGARRYVPLADLGAEPHVIVDGAARPATALCLSHWPGTPTPVAVRADLSAEIVRRAQLQGLLDGGPPAVTIDHYDEDGVAALALAVLEGLTATDGDVLVEAARVGDFGVVRDRRAALVAFALAALVDPVRTPVPALAGLDRPRDPLTVTALAAAHALILLPELLRRPEAHARLWRAEFDSYTAAVGALDSGWAAIEDRLEVDLAVVRVATTQRDASRARWGDRALHPAAVHSATTCCRVATVNEGAVEVRDRYETWVRLAEPPPRRRVDLAALAGELTRLEPSGTTWSYDGAGAVTPALHVDNGGSSGLDPEQVVDLVHRRLLELDQGPPAWDPYAAAMV